jgi:group I intron endonuclease
VVKSGIYLIKNTINGKVYVGSSIDINKRWREHLHYLRLNTHANTHLQRAWNKYGEESFKFEVIEKCPTQKLLNREQYWIDLLEVIKKGYNLSPTAGSCLGIKKSKRQRRKMRLVGLKLAQNFDEAWRQKVIAGIKASGGSPKGMLGKRHSKITRMKMRKAKLGVKKSPEHIKNQSESHKGTQWSEEACLRHSLAQKLRWKNHPLKASTSAKLKVSVKNGWAKRRKI